jgi:hypothetical protein
MNAANGVPPIDKIRQNPVSKKHLNLFKDVKMCHFQALLGHLRSKI